MTLPNNTYTGSEQISSTRENSIEQCINKLNNIDGGGTFYDTLGNNCFLYKSNNSNITSGVGTAIVYTTQYYNEKMVELYDKIKTQLNIQPVSLDPPPSLSDSDYTITNKNFTDADEIMKMIDEKYNDSVANVQLQEVKMKVWLFIFLFVMLFFSLIVDSLKIFFFLFVLLLIIVFLNIVKTVNTIVFSLLLIVSFIFVVLRLYFVKMYIPSIVILIFGTFGYEYLIKYPFIIGVLIFGTIFSI
uniref:Uncharacterized protein n=1 Tax=viral metagenome TaxID=1070528 RepID=A0A6C0HSL9_9ZZZZ